MFNNPDQRRHLQWLNIKVLDSNSKRPDFGANILKSSNWVGPVLIGEIKGEDKKHDNYMCLLDLYRTSSLSLESISQNKYKGIIGIQIIGMHVPFYITTQLASKFYVMMEICSITLPKDRTEILSYFPNVSNLLPVLKYYESSFEVQDNIEPDNVTSFDETKVICMSKDRKRKCPVVLNYWTPSFVHIFFSCILIIFLSTICITTSILHKIKYVVPTFKKHINTPLSKTS
ncbi:hypothetical protein BD770DRAFT_388796 [Pilaira anomala]|nr:hypothetical protein BD770DRAFT_388796 [Pilaira anomala]